MKAIVQDAYGGPEVLRLADIDPPRIAADEVLVRVHAASVHPDVWHVMTGRPWILRLMGSGLRRPKRRVPGTDLAGVVEAVGTAVTTLGVGDEVFGETVTGLQWMNGGAFAEHAAVKALFLARKPASVSFEQAATVPTAGLIALNNLRGMPTGPGCRVLVNGAGGGVGALALQMAKASGATVTGVETTARLELVRSLGADAVIDYTREDFTRAQQRYDLIFDIPGNHSFSRCRRVLTPEGKYVLIAHDGFGARGRRILGGLPSGLWLMLQARFRRNLPRASFAMPPKAESMATLQKLLEDGKLTPVVAKAFPLAEVREAMRHLIEGLCVGRIVVTM